VHGGGCVEKGKPAIGRDEAAPARIIAVFPAIIYIVAFVTGAIVMSFEMLDSRYLNPYFFLIPLIGTRAITLLLGVAGAGCGLV
jgi:hypothetical protein